jgi:hypothetical protein
MISGAQIDFVRIFSIHHTKRHDNARSFSSMNFCSDVNPFISGIIPLIMRVPVRFFRLSTKNVTMLMRENVVLATL